MTERIQKFEDLVVWKEALKLSVEISKALKTSRNFGLRDQMQRSAVSVPSNIAEGFERQSNKEFIRYLYIAKASCAELRTQLYIAVETEIIDKLKGAEYIECTRKISAMLYNLIKTRRENF